jgi:hypothetical protein
VAQVVEQYPTYDGTVVERTEVSAMTDCIPVLAPLADRLEEFLVQRFRREYAWVVRALTTLSSLLLVVSGVLFLAHEGGWSRARAVRSWRSPAPWSRRSSCWGGAVPAAGAGGRPHGRGGEDGADDVEPTASDVETTAEEAASVAEEAKERLGEPDDASEVSGADGGDDETLHRVWT